jgi:twitching motility two-component system response regulator PilG
MNKSILVVDDELDLLRTIEIFLQGEGYDVVTAPDGLKARELMELNCPALILSDIMMPRWNGYQLLEFVKEHESFKHIPVVLMSAVDLRNQGLTPDFYLKKPFDLDLLLEAIKKFIK